MRGQSEVSPLFRAIDHGDIKAVEAILKTNPQEVHATIPGPSVGPDTPLHAAASHGHLPIAELLIRRGAKVNARGDGGLTPLHTAANNGHVEVVELLLKHGADLEAESMNHRRPLHMCYRGRDPRCAEVARVLLDRGARVDLHIAMAQRDSARVRQMLRDDPAAVADDPLAEWLFPAFVALVVDKIDQRMYALEVTDGLTGAHSAPQLWRRASQQVVLEEIDILEELIVRKAPAERRGLWAIRSAMEVADVRVVQRLLEYGVPKPSERDPLWMTTKLHLPQNPCRHELEALFRKHWGEFWG